MIDAINIVLILLAIGFLGEVWWQGRIHHRLHERTHEALEKLSQQATDLHEATLGEEEDG